MIYKKEIGVRTAARVYSDVVVPGLRNGEFFGNGLEIIGGRPGFSYYFFYDGVRFRCCCKEYFDFFRNICVASACVYGAQNEAYMSRSAEKWVRGLCFNELDVCG